MRVDRQTLLMHVINSVGETLDMASARAMITNLVESEALDLAVGRALLVSMDDKTLRAVPQEARNTVRADLLKQVLIQQV